MINKILNQRKHSSLDINKEKIQYKFSQGRYYEFCSSFSEHLLFI